MKTKNILRTLLLSAFVFGTLAMNAQDKVYVYKSDGTAVEFNIADIDSISFSVPPLPPDYTKLKLNEVSGVGGDDEKFYELINTGTADIPLEGCKIYYNANGSTAGVFPPVDNRLTWAGSEGQIAEAGKLFSLIGRNTPGSFTTGLTAARILVITLEDPDGNVIDECIRAEDSVEPYIITDKSFSRIPDGTGPFYFTTQTPDQLNGSEATGLLVVPETRVPSVNYTKIKINEVNGVGKWFEFYNTGDVEMSLEGFTVYYSNKEPAEYKLTWTGTAAQTIPAGGYFTTPTDDGGGSLATGLSANNGNVRLQLRAPNGVILDTYEKPIDINTGYDEIKNKSHARIPDGTGFWYYTTDNVGTPEATNGTSITDYMKFGDENGVVIIDYTNLLINEVDGNGKFVEIYNKGTESISLAGLTLIKNEETATGDIWWTGGTSASVAAGGFYTIAQSGGAVGADEYTGNGGISPKKNVKFELKEPDQTVIDFFVRSETIDLDVDVLPDYGTGTPLSFSRCPDGGDFMLAIPSCNATNNSAEDEITTILK